MTRRHAVAAAGLVALAALAVCGFVALRRPRNSGRAPSGAVSTPAPVTSSQARRSLEGSHFYRLLFERHAVRASRVEADGAIELEIDPRAAARKELSRLGWPELEDALPASARLRVVRDHGVVHETWWLSCAQACVLDVFATAPGRAPAPPAVPGRPAALLGFRIAPERFRDLALGGRSTEILARRAELIEQLLGRSLREPFAEDLTGNGTLALYRNERGTRSLTVLEMSRTDRIRSVVDLAVGLAALTHGASVRTHRDVPVGSWSRSGGGGVAIAVTDRT